MSLPPKTNSLDSLYLQAAEAARAGSRTFFFATRFFPPDLARAAHAVYWFRSYTRELVLQAATPEQGRADLDQWASLVSAGLRGRLARHPVLEVYLDTAEQRGIPHDCALDLIEGARMDLDHTRYQSFSQLREYGYRTSGMVSVMMAHVVGYRGPALDAMADLGLAAELTSVLRNVGEHIARGRIYLPLEEMDGFGYSESDLRAHTRNPPFLALMRFQAERARGYYHKARPGIQLLDPRGRFAMQVAYDLSLRTLDRMGASRFDVFHRRPAVPAVQRYWITARSMAGPITRHLWRNMSA
jgi:phytoene synthase